MLFMERWKAIAYRLRWTQEVKITLGGSRGADLGLEIIPGSLLTGPAQNLAKAIGLSGQHTCGGQWGQLRAPW